VSHGEPECRRSRCTASAAWVIPHRLHLRPPYPPSGG
jgi:hypothetical protein